VWRVRTGGRLHLGLLSLPADGERWPDREGHPAFVARRFGGVGLMIDAPGLSLRVEPADEWSAEGPLAERALEFAQRAAGFIPAVRTAGTSPAAHRPPRRIVVEAAPRDHVGLGVGTQLGLAVARGLAASWGLQAPTATLAGWVGRGRRSALGVYGFEQGGFLVEAGKASDDLSPLVARLPFPEAWRVVFVVPPGATGRHGTEELAAFERLTAPLAVTDALCRLVLLGMLPALASRDLAAFGEAAHDFNARSGEMFAGAQGGIYASAEVAELISWLRGIGVRGVGQSSWGPGVFAFVGDEENAHGIARQIQARIPTAEVHVARGLNEGHSLL
jgi:beta-ribofuranosylaminobenzene 5'-phosphate synthase